MNEQKAEVDMSEQAVRGHVTTGKRMEVAYEEQGSESGVGNYVKNGRSFPMEEIQQLTILTDVRYAVHGSILFDMSRNGVVSAAVTLCYTDEASANNDEPPIAIFNAAVEYEDLPEGEWDNADAAADTYKQLLALAARAAERHRDLVAPPEVVHHCGNPACPFEGQMASLITARGEIPQLKNTGEVFIVNYHPGAPADVTVH